MKHENANQVNALKLHANVSAVLPDQYEHRASMKERRKCNLKV